MSASQARYAQGHTLFGPSQAEKNAQVASRHPALNDKEIMKLQEDQALMEERNAEIDRENERLRTNAVAEYVAKMAGKAQQPPKPETKAAAPERENKLLDLSLAQPKLERANSGCGLTDKEIMRLPGVARVEERYRAGLKPNDEELKAVVIAEYEAELRAREEAARSKAQAKANQAATFFEQQHGKKLTDQEKEALVRGYQLFGSKKNPYFG